MLDDGPALGEAGVFEQLATSTATSTIANFRMVTLSGAVYAQITRR